MQREVAIPAKMQSFVEGITLSFEQHSMFLEVSFKSPGNCEAWFQGGQCEHERQISVDTMKSPDLEITPRQGETFVMALPITLFLELSRKSR